MITILQKYKYPFIALFFSVWGLILRFIRLAQRDLWGDEIYQFLMIRGPLKAFWFPYYTYGDQTSYPGEYILHYWLVATFGRDKWMLAIPHIIITIVGFYLLYRICQRYFKTALGFTIAFAVVCFNAELIFHSFEFRPYATLPLISIGAYCFIEEIITQGGKISKTKKFWMGAFLVFSAIYHAFGLFIITIITIYLFLIHRKGSYLDILKSENFYFFRIVFIIAVPLWLWYASFNTFGLQRNLIQDPHPPFEFLPNPGRDLIGFLKAVFGNLIGFKPLYLLLPGIFFPYMFPYQERRKQIAFFLFLVIFPLALFLVLCIKNEMWYLQRQWTWIMVLFAFYLGWSWESAYLYLKEKFKK